MPVDASAVASVTGVDVQFEDLKKGSIYLLPQRVALIAQGATASTYATTKRQIFSAAEAGSVYGFGSPIHLAAREFFPADGDGIGTVPLTVYPLVDDGAGVAAAGDITPSGSQTAVASYKVVINEIESEDFLVSPGDAVSVIVAAMTAAINAVPAMPVDAVDNAGASCDLTSKWEGESANDIFVEVVGDALGVTYTITQPTGGLNNPDIAAALGLIGGVWETLVLNALDDADTTALDALKTEGENRWGPLVKKPFVAFHGSTETSVATATTVSDARKDDRVNVQLVAPGSKNLPFVVAARQLARIAVVANGNPPVDYVGQRATGLEPGDDGDQWDYAQRDAAIKAGSSTIEVKDGVIEIGDVVTFWHPTGEPVPAYRHVVDVVKLQNIIFNLDLIFSAQEWAAAPLIPDNQPTVNPAARKPRSAKAAAARMLDSLGLQAIISDPATAKKSIVATIDSGNPKRLNLEATVALAGNTKIKDVTLKFGFFFGAQPIAA